MQKIEDWTDKSERMDTYWIKRDNTRLGFGNHYVERFNRTVLGIDGYRKDRMERFLVKKGD